MAGSAEPVLRLSVTRAGETAVLRVIGEVDVATSGRLQARLLDLLEPRRAVPVRCLVVDLAGVSFLDLTGLRVLLDAEAGLRRHGGRLLLRSPNRGVRRLLEVLDLRDRLPVEGDRGVPRTPI